MGADNVLSIIAVVIAGLSFLFTYCKYRKYDKKLKAQQKQINEFNLKKIRRQEEDDKKAYLEVDVIKEIKGRRRVTIYNSGKAPAQNVKVNFSDAQNVNIGDYPDNFVLKPRKSIEITIQFFIGAPDNIKMNWEWQDAFKQKNVDSQTIYI